MKFIAASFLLCVGIVVFPLSAEAFSFFGGEEDLAVEEDTPVNVIADQLEFVKKENKMIGKGNVIVTYKELKMTCDYAEVFTDTKKAFAQGHVVLNRNGDRLKGTEASYDFKNSAGTFPNGTSFDQPYYCAGAQMEQVSADKIIIQDGTITTCSNAKILHKTTHYEVKASKIFIYPNDKIVAHNVVYRVLGKPVFWLPYLNVPLEDGHAPFHVQPGFSSDDGWYLLSSKRYSINENIRGKGHVDYRAKRGWGFGNDVDYGSDLLGDGIVKVYIADDKNSPNQKFSNSYSNRHNDTRYRLTAKHRKNIGRTVFLAEINKLSDEYFLKDFFEREYHEDAEPETFVNITHNRNNFGIFANLEKRINHFVSTVEKLPEVRFNWNNQELGNSNVYYKNEESLINFNKKTARSDIDTDVVRLDTFHEIAYPKRLFFVSLKPFLNWRSNYYSKNNADEENMTRQVAGGGIDIGTKFYRIFDINTNVLKLDVNGVRHILEPTIKYNSIRHCSVSPSKISQMDSIDEIDDLDTIRFGIDNTFQTKRMRSGKETTVNIVSYNTYLTYEFNAEERGGSGFLTWDNEMEFRPYSWLMMTFDTTYDIPKNEFSSADLDLTIRNKERWHIYLQQKFLKEGSKIVTADAMYKINSRWGVGGYIRREFSGDDITEEWELRATRDLHCWFLDLGYNVRSSDVIGDSKNREIFMQLTLKAFPEYPLKSGNHATYSRARIGDTVSGATSESSEVEESSYALLHY